MHFYTVFDHILEHEEGKFANVEAAYIRATSLTRQAGVTEFLTVCKPGSMAISKPDKTPLYTARLIQPRPVGRPAAPKTLEPKPFKFMGRPSENGWLKGTTTHIKLSLLTTIKLTDEYVYYQVFADRDGKPLDVTKLDIMPEVRRQMDALPKRAGVSVSMTEVACQLAAKAVGTGPAEAVALYVVCSANRQLRCLAQRYA